MQVTDDRDLSSLITQQHHIVPTIGRIIRHCGIVARVQSFLGLESSSMRTEQADVFEKVVRLVLFSLFWLILGPVVQPCIGLDTSREGPLVLVLPGELFQLNLAFFLI